MFMIHKRANYHKLIGIDDLFFDYLYISTFTINKFIE